MVNLAIVVVIVVMVGMMMVMLVTADCMPSVAARAHVLEPLEAVVVHHRVMDSEVEVLVLVVRTRAWYVFEALAPETGARWPVGVRPAQALRGRRPRALPY